MIGELDWAAGQEGNSLPILFTRSTKKDLKANMIEEKRREAKSKRLCVPTLLRTTDTLHCQLWVSRLLTHVITTRHVTNLWPKHFA